MPLPLAAVLHLGAVGAVLFGWRRRLSWLLWAGSLVLLVLLVLDSSFVSLGFLHSDVWSDPTGLAVEEVDPVGRLRES